MEDLNDDFVLMLLVVNRCSLPVRGGIHKLVSFFD